jgi:hypothetical protein
MSYTRTGGVAAATLLALGGCVTAVDDPNGIVELKAPLRLAPLPGQEVSYVLARLTWTDTAGATEYEVYLGTDPNPPLFANSLSNGINIRDLPRCTVHYWRVVALNGDEALISTPTWQFTTFCEPDGLLP